VNRRAALGKPFRHLLVATAVLGVAMHEQQRPRGAIGKPGAPEDLEAVVRAQMRLDPAQRGLSGAFAQDWISRFIRSRAARTRFR
jgi:hypothetical protein